MRCSICGARVEPEAFVCLACGAPADYRASSGDVSSCCSCGRPLWTLAETCVHCRRSGYPALEPPLESVASRRGERLAASP